jgi:hypothetical protein
MKRSDRVDFTTTLVGASGRSYVFQEISRQTQIADVPGIFMIATLRGVLSPITVMGPRIGFAITLQREVWPKADQESGTVTHNSNVLIHPISAEEGNLLTVWKDLRKGGANPLPSFVQSEWQ